MKRNLIIIIAVLIAAFGVTYALDFAPHTPVTHTPSVELVSAQCADEKMAPNFTFTDIRGKTHTLSDFRGRVVILNFWASWCAPCVKEFPHFLKAAQDYPDEVIFLAASSDFNRAAMDRFTNKMTTAHPEAMAQPNVILFHDENQAITLDQFQTLRLPETILIDARGAMKAKIVGADWGYDDLLQGIENTMKSTKSSC